MKWSSIKTFEDIKLEKSSNNPLGIIKITINRPKLRNAFRPKTVFELKEAFNYAKEDNDCGVVILTGKKHQILIRKLYELGIFHEFNLFTALSRSESERVRESCRSS